MKTFFVSAISVIGALLAATATNGCIAVWLDEPKMPNSMLER